MRKQGAEQQDEFDNEIRREDGLTRYGRSSTGTSTVYSLLLPLPSSVLWGFLYILGAGLSIVGIVLACLAAASFMAWRTLDQKVQQYQDSDWKLYPFRREPES